MIKGVITGDIIESTKLSDDENNTLIQGLKYIIDELEQNKTIRGEIFRGDSLQCLVHKPSQTLKIALLIKTYVKGIDSINKKQKNELDKLINKPIFDIRLAIGIGEINSEKEKLSISQGEAFNLSGRLLDDMKNKQTIAIKTNDR